MELTLIRSVVWIKDSPLFRYGLPNLTPISFIFFVVWGDMLFRWIRIFNVPAFISSVHFTGLYGGRRDIEIFSFLYPVMENKYRNLHVLLVVIQLIIEVSFFLKKISSAIRLNIYSNTFKLPFNGGYITNYLKKKEDVDVVYFSSRLDSDTSAIAGNELHIMVSGWSKKFLSIL